MSNLDATSFSNYYSLLSNSEQGFETRNYYEAFGRTNWVCVHALVARNELFFGGGYIYRDKPFFLLS